MRCDFGFFFAAASASALALAAAALAAFSRSASESSSSSQLSATYAWSGLLRPLKRASYVHHQNLPRRQICGGQQGHLPIPPPKTLRTPRLDQSTVSEWIGYAKEFECKLPREGEGQLTPLCRRHDGAMLRGGLPVDIFCGWDGERVRIGVEENLATGSYRMQFEEMKGRISRFVGFCGDAAATQVGMPSLNPIHVHLRLRISAGSGRGSLGWSLH